MVMVMVIVIVIVIARAALEDRAESMITLVPGSIKPIRNVTNQFIWDRSRLKIELISSWSMFFRAGWSQVDKQHAQTECEEAGDCLINYRSYELQFTINVLHTKC